MPSPITRQRTILRFTTIWLVGSVAVSTYFSFVLFPRIFDARNGAIVRVLFKTEQPEVIYFPNTRAFRAQYKKNTSDDKFLYFSACEVLPISQRPACDPTKNWKKMEPGLVGCDDVEDCDIETYRMSPELRYSHIAGMDAVKGSSINIVEATSLSFSDPATWGSEASWPIFFVSMFLALKLGRALGDFVFSGYKADDA